MSRKCCKTCKWHRMEDGGDGLCVDKESENYIDRTDDDFVCEKWEAED